MRLNFIYLIGFVANIIHIFVKTQAINVNTNYMFIFIKKRMKNCIKLIALVVAITTIGCSSDDSGSADLGDGLNAQATYKITFNPDFSEMDHPTDYPDNASFAKMFVMAHSSNTTLYTIGSAATDGLKRYVTDGDIGGLQSEYSGEEGTSNATKIAIGNAIGATGSSDSVTIVINPDLLEISFVSKISPSPDWFVGVRSFSLVNPDNSLVDYIEIPVYPLDGGADAGTTYNAETSPETGPVAIINGYPFTPPESGNIIKRFGNLTIERIN